MWYIIHNRVLFKPLKEETFRICKDVDGPIGLSLKMMRRNFEHSFKEIQIRIF